MSRSHGTIRDAELERWINATRVLKQRAEQAERERDGAERMWLAAAADCREYHARLAKVPALVEALRQISDYGTERQKAIAARDALTVWEQE